MSKLVLAIAAVGVVAAAGGAYFVFGRKKSPEHVSERSSMPRAKPPLSPSVAHNALVRKALSDTYSKGAQAQIAALLAVMAIPNPAVRGEAQQLMNQLKG